MKLDQLRKVIREEVKTAIKEELQEIMNEAVRAASEPEKQTFYGETPYTGTTSKGSGDIRPHTANLQESGDPIMDILNQTQANMTSGNYNTPSQPTHDMVSKPNFASMMASNMGMNENAGPLPGIDLSQLDFVKKAGSIYKKSIELDKQKGIL